MAITQNTYTGNGSTTNYSFTFEYLEQTDVKITLDTVATTAFTFANATTIAFTTAPASDVAIRIYRDTDIDSLSATFFPGSAIKAEDLNSNFAQTHFATQETDNEITTAISDAAAAKTSAESAVTKADEAKTTADAADTKADDAETTAASAVTTANTASTTATTANTNATNAVNTAIYISFTYAVSIGSKPFLLNKIPALLFKTLSISDNLTKLQFFSFAHSTYLSINFGAVFPFL